MRVTIASILLLSFSVSLPGQERKSTVLFDGFKLVLTHSQEAGGDSLKEYIPEGEKLDSWTKLAGVWEYSKQNDPAEVANLMLDRVKQQNPLAPSQIMRHKATGDVVLDLVSWSADNSFAEFNVFKFTKKPGGGVTGHQYAVREYKNPVEFLKGLNGVRERLVPLMFDKGLIVEK